MKKLLVLVVLLGVGGLVAWKYLWGAPEKRACAKLQDLCGKDKEADRCTSDLGELRKVGGDETADKASACVMEAKTCGEAVGCVAGGYGRAGMKALGDVFKGFGKAISDDKDKDKK